jgi:lipopolysaccharide/colanic/teichoic acid biosynthesis glycosyltransferase
MKGEDAPRHTRHIVSVMHQVAHRRGADMGKRAFDVTAAVLGLIILAPVFLIIGVWIRATSPGPVFYRARRVGRNGVLFSLVKFRSMVMNADRLGAGITAGDDPRITRPGRFLRRTKLDELPQLINVVHGDMSLVGPRPEDPRYVKSYTPAQRRVLTVRPGITSWASVQYRHEEQLLTAASVDEVYRREIMPRKLALDLDYIARRSFWLDARILLHTLLALFK